MPRFSGRAGVALLALLPLSAVAACEGAGNRASSPASGVDASSPFPGTDGALTDAGGTAVTDATPDAGQVAPPLPAPPSGGGLGATPLADGGVLFGVWAPNATGVDVEGTFASQPIPLVAGDGGIFAGTVASAAVGDSYSYAIHTSSGVLQRLDPRARDLDGKDAVVVDPRSYPWTTPFTMPPKNEVVVYELHVGAFTASGGGHGTFASTMTELDWLQSLGVNAIELLPSNDFGSDDGWGYDPASYFTPHPSYGSSTELRALVDAAHAHGIGVLFDVVYNHYESVTGGPLDCFDGLCPDHAAGIYFFSDPTYALTPWGPRPDFSNPRVSDFVADGAFAWFAESHIDGLRWDSVSNIRALNGSGTVPGGQAVLQRSNDAVHALRPDALLIAEDLQGDAEITAPTSSGGYGFDTQWDGYGSVVSAVTASSDAARDIDSVTGTINASYNGDPFARVLYTESHDTVGNGGSRLPDEIDPSTPTSLQARKNSLLATLALLTAPAVPMLFMGEEMLATGTFDDPPAQLDWSLATTNAPIVAFYRDALGARRNLGGVTAGLLGPNVNVYHVNESAKVIAYRRWDAAGNDVVVALNFGGTAYASYLLGMPEAGTWHVRINSDDTKYGSDFGGASSADVVTTSAARDAMPNTGSLALGAYAGVVLSQ
jgi:1,4-alpha-glucan branching enzyme